MLINTARVQAALAYASEHHAAVAQQRAIKTPYMVHPYAVMGIIQRSSEDYGAQLENALCVSVLHDTLEDTKATVEEIRQKFGDAVAHATSALTKNKLISDKLDATIDSLDRCERIGAWVVGVKCADRIENLNFVTVPDTWSRERRIHYVQKESTIILYRGRKAGMHQTCERLEAAMKIYELYIPPT